MEHSQFLEMSITRGVPVYPRRPAKSVKEPRKMTRMELQALEYMDEQGVLGPDLVVAVRLVRSGFAWRNTVGIYQLTPEGTRAMRRST